MNISCVELTAERNLCMAMSTSINGNMGVSDRELQTGKFGAVSISGKKQREKEDGKGSVMFGGQFDPVEQKKALAKKQAYKIVKDALANELKMDSTVQEVKDHADRLRGDIETAQNEIGRIEEEKEKWREECGVDADSQEQKDLELLEKREAYGRGDLSKALTEEEEKRLAEIDEQGYTEYQKRALALEKHKAPYEDTVNKAEAGIMADNAVIRGTRLARLKKDLIRKAQNEAEDVLAAASEEVIGMLVDEAKEHMDEKSEELQEKAEERAEEKEQQQEKIDAAKEKKEQMEALADPEKAGEDCPTDTHTGAAMTDPVTETMVRLDSQRADYQQEIEEMMRKMNLMAEDLKGIKVDETIK